MVRPPSPQDRLGAGAGARGPQQLTGSPIRPLCTGTQTRSGPSKRYPGIYAGELPRTTRAECPRACEPRRLQRYARVRRRLESCATDASAPRPRHNKIDPKTKKKKHFPRKKVTRKAGLSLTERYRRRQRTSALPCVPILLALTWAVIPPDQAPSCGSTLTSGWPSGCTW